MSIAIGYMPGAFGEGGENPDYLRQLVAAGDKHGYDSIWLSDRIVSDKFSLESMTACAMVAAYSDRLKFGTSVIAMPLRNPVVLAKQIATLDFLSQGRFFPAVGLGQEEPEEYEACGVTKDRRGPRTDEAIELMRRLWEEQNVTHEGEFYACHNVTVTPKPFLQPSTPVWIGGRTAAAARRVGRVGDGWLVSSATPAEVKEGAEIVFDTANEFNREIEPDHIGVLLGYYAANDVEEATLKANRYVTRHRPDAHFTEFTAVGPVDRIAEYIHRYIQSGRLQIRSPPPMPRRGNHGTTGHPRPGTTAAVPPVRETGRPAMGLMRVTATVRNPANLDRIWQAEFAAGVDTVDCLAPRQHLEAIGLAPLGRRICRLPDGGSKTLDFTIAQIELMNQIGGATIYLLDAAAEPVIGRTTLLSMGLEVDQASRTLVKLPHIPMPGLRPAANRHK